MEEDGILLSFDVVSLYTKIPIDEAIDIIKNKVDNDIANLVEVCPISIHFLFLR